QGAIGHSTDGSYQLYSGFWRAEPSMTCAGSAVCYPDTHWVFEAHALDFALDTVYCGNFGLCSADDIDTSTIRVNESIVPSTIEVLDEEECPPAVGYAGRVLRLEVPTCDLVLSFGWLYDESVQQVYVSGNTLSGAPCAAVAEVLLFGHVSGDVNSDGLVDIADLVYMVSFLFTGGPPPPFDLAADLDGSCTVDIADLVYLVDYMFSGGPEPLAPCGGNDVDSK
ncbi:MAG: dockerin type I repeat-containing protein, partial [candidate division Zixibacteria bacterium]|nr:dockerin type I repeat-containing protein [candidate division Zixibacteria bacterium]